MPLGAGLAIGAISGIVKTGIGLSNYNSASDDLATARRPVYNIPKEWYDDANIEGNLAQTGLTSSSMNYFNTQNDRGLESGIAGTLQAGGNVNNIADLYDQYDQGANKIAEEDSQLKNQNIQNFIAANSNLANEKDKAWTLNEYEPYKDRVKADNAKMAAGQQTAFNGLGDITNTLAAFNTSQQYKTGDAGTPVVPASAGGDGADAGSAAAVFSSPGGAAAIKSMASRNPNSPYMKLLLQAVNQPQ